MRTNKIALALTGLVLMVLMVPLVFANGNGNGELVTEIVVGARARAHST